VEHRRWRLAARAAATTRCEAVWGHVIAPTATLLTRCRRARPLPTQLRRKVAALADEGGRLREALQDAEGRVSAPRLRWRA
jgi:hypothetical protein